MIKPMSKTVIYCPAHEDYTAARKLLSESGLTWGLSCVPIDTAPHNWDTWGGSYCFNISKYNVTFANKTYYVSEGYKIMTVAELQEANVCSANVCSDCKGTGVYVGFSLIEPCRKCKGAKI